MDVNNVESIKNGLSKSDEKFDIIFDYIFRKQEKSSVLRHIPL